MSFVFPVLLTLFVIGIAVWVSVRSMRQHRVLERVDADLGAQRKGRLSAGRHGDTAYHYEYFSGSKNSPSYLEVSVAAIPDTRFRIVREGALARAAKRVGLSHEIQTGDDEFDRTFYLEVEPEDVAAGFLADEPARSAVRALFGDGVAAIENRPGELVARWSPYSLGSGFSAGTITSAVERVAELRRRLSGAGVGALAPRGPVTSTAAALVSGALFIAVVLAAGLLTSRYPPVDEGRVLVDSLGVSALLIAALVGAVVFHVHGRSTAHRILGGALIAILIVVPFAGWALTVWANGALDDSPGVTHDLVVTGKHEVEGRNPSYRITVPSWRDPARPRDLEVGRDAYDAVIPGRTHVTIVTHAGRCGYEWRESMRIDPVGVAD